MISVWLIGYYIIPHNYDTNYFSSYNFLIQGSLQISLVLLFLTFTNRNTLRNIIEVDKYKWYTLAIITGILFRFSLAPLFLIYSLLSGNEYDMIFHFKGLSVLSNLNYITGIILAPLSEELIFRGYIQGHLLKNIDYKWAILGSAILFSLLHAPYFNLFSEFANFTWRLSFITLFGGLISGILYHKSKSLGTSIIFHAFWNLSAFLI